MTKSEDIDFCMIIVYPKLSALSLHTKYSHCTKDYLCFNCSHLMSFATYSLSKANVVTPCRIAQYLLFPSITSQTWSLPILTCKHDDLGVFPSLPDPRNKLTYIEVEVPRQCLWTLWAALLIRVAALLKA